MDWTIWGAVATVIAALVAAFMSWRALRLTKVQGQREHAFVRFQAALDHLYSGNEDRARQGASLLRHLRRSKWLSDDDRKMVIQAIDAYVGRRGA